MSFLKSLKKGDKFFVGVMGSSLAEVDSCSAEVGAWEVVVLKDGTPVGVQSYRDY